MNQPTFIRIVRLKEDKEILLNVNHISKIEIEYALPPKDDHGYAGKVRLEKGLSDPNAIRFYRVYIAGDQEAHLVLQPGDPVMEVLEKIYKSAIKGNIAFPEE